MFQQQSRYLLRNYRASDFEGLVKLHLEAEKRDLTGVCPSPSRLRERLQHPRFVSEEGIIVVEKNGEIVAFMEVFHEKEIKRLLLSCVVHPYHRRKGLAGMLLDAAMKIAAKLEAKVAHVNVDRHNLGAQRALLQFGFLHVRTFLELRLEMRWACLEHLSGQKNLYLRHLHPGEEPLLARLQNRCFAGTWGFNPNTAEDIFYSTYLENSSIRDVILASQGKEPVAYCWTKVEPESNKGRILMMGVVPERRGEKIASPVLLAGISYLHQRGMEIVELTVDSDNTPACRLYFSTGFRVWSESLWFEKSLSVCSKKTW